MDITDGQATAVLQKIGDLAVQEKTAILGDYAERISNRERQQHAQRVLELAPNMAHSVTADVSRFLDDVVEVLYFSGRQRTAAEFGLQFPIYDVAGSYDFNAALPWFKAPTKRATQQGRRWSLFGQEIGFPIGVPASALTGSASQVAELAKSGYNVITFKTVRSRSQPASAAPNWVMLSDAREPLPIDLNREQFVVHGSPEDWVSPGSGDISTANSFGVPSLDPVEWAAELKIAQRSISSDQLLIVSVMGDDYGRSGDRSTIIADWVRVAQDAVAAGARHIELNLSCPNTLSPSSPDGVHPPLCEDVDLSTDIVHAVRQNIDVDINLIAKLSYLDFEPLRQLTANIADHVAAIAGINTLPLKVLNSEGVPTFGSRVRAGVSGIAIRNYALRFVENLHRIRVEGKHSYDIIGMGGVTDTSSFRAMYEAGASVVQSASAVFHDVSFGQRCATDIGDTLDPTPPIKEDLRASYESAVKSALTRRPSGRYEVATRLPFPIAHTFEILAQLADKKDGVVAIKRRAGQVQYALEQS